VVASPARVGQKILNFSKARLDCKNKHCLIQAGFFIHMQYNLIANSFLFAQLIL
jgi:hypothetical protein